MIATRLVLAAGWLVWAWAIAVIVRGILDERSLAPGAAVLLIYLVGGVFGAKVTKSVWNW